MSVWWIILILLILVIVAQAVAISVLNKNTESSEVSGEESEGFARVVETMKDLFAAAYGSKETKMSSESSGVILDQRIPLLPEGFVDYSREATGDDFKTSQDLTQSVAEEVFGVPFKKNVRPSWMKPPGRKNAIELDMLSTVPVGPTQQHIAIEYNGEQHYRFPNFYHKDTKEGLEKYVRQCENDDMKPGMCNAKGVYLITVPYNAHRRGKFAREDIKRWLIHHGPERQLALTQQQMGGQFGQTVPFSTGSFGGQKGGFAQPVGSSLESMKKKSFSFPEEFGRLTSPVSILKTPTVRGFPIGPPGMRGTTGEQFSFAMPPAPFVFDRLPGYGIVGEV